MNFEWADTCAEFNEEQIWAVKDFLIERSGYFNCSYCGCSTPYGKPIIHWAWCITLKKLKENNE
jgi:hypothetical protein